MENFDSFWRALRCRIRILLSLRGEHHLVGFTTTHSPRGELITQFFDDRLYVYEIFLASRVDLARLACLETLTAALPRIVLEDCPNTLQVFPNLWNEFVRARLADGPCDRPIALLMPAA